MSNRGDPFTMFLEKLSELFTLFELLKSESTTHLFGKRAIWCSHILHFRPISRECRPKTLTGSKRE